MTASSFESTVHALGCVCVSVFNFCSGLSCCLMMNPNLNGSSYRLCDPSEKHIYKSSPLFGQILTVKQTGILQVGDEVFKIIR